MNRKDQADIPDRLGQLRKVAAPANLENHLNRRIRSLPPRNRYLSWFLRPIPVALAVAVGALAVAAYFAIPLYLSTSNSLPGEDVIPVPLQQRDSPLPGQSTSGNANPGVSLVADSLSSDSSSRVRSDVNTSKLP